MHLIIYNYNYIVRNIVCERRASVASTERAARRVSGSVTARELVRYDLFM